LFEIRDLRGPTNQFGFALQICALRYLGFSPTRILQAPLMARLYLAEQLGINLAQINEYGLREPNTRLAPSSIWVFAPLTTLTNRNY